MARLTLRIVTGLLTFIIGLLAWMVFVFATPAETLDTPHKTYVHGVVRTDAPSPAKTHRCPNR
jgi:hypothetical protein